ncbi:DEAD/DEAH box helicase [Bacillaceae bacterium S4-13-56]
MEDIFIKEPQPFILKAWDKAGFEDLTTVQKKAIPVIEEGKDVIAEAPTGTGKTLAYLLPLLQNVDLDQVHPQVLILASSHELVMQIHEQVQVWGEGSGIRSATLIGGANPKRQLEKLKKHPHIIVGTPGRVDELSKQKKLKMHEVKTIVLDEADQLMVPEHQAKVDEVIKRALADRQLVVISATVSNDMEQFFRTRMKEPAVIRVNLSEDSKPLVDHIFVVVEERDKLETLRKIHHAEEGKTLVFARDIGNLSVMAEKLRFKGIDVAVLHSDSKKQDRAKAIRDFRSGAVSFMLATDVAARGLDIQDITHVIQLDVPKESAQYIHRSGRTGRLGSELDGKVISIVTESESSKLRKIANELKIQLQKKTLYKGKLQGAK